MKASSDARDGRQIPLLEPDFLAPNQPLGRTDATPSSLLELISTGFCLSLCEFYVGQNPANPDKPGYTGLYRDKK